MRTVISSSSSMPGSSTAALTVAMPCSTRPVGRS